ncbi:hypothetical protein KC340_g10486 [Hortaea werneckii]|nr:hypothetical protein KC339_g2492 [Hortaea werneckii]KAI7231057.1 hypothetical protein KC365_g7368 [Hortaea werneckii]KAI7310449.1 hypothetical protein KC340_g10486 [Hortaea werneckii]KAI7407449.1 hypothetical protein KC328_g503 [Hortaea werneckii]
MLQYREAPKEYKLYHYDPSVVAAVVFALLFMISLLWHIFQFIRHRIWFFIPFVVGVIFEAVGYAARGKSGQQAPDFEVTPYVIQSLLTLLGPSFFAASIYMILGRIIRLTDGERHSMIRSNWLTKIFVLGDVLSFFVQSGGGGMLANAKDQDTVDLANKVVLAGLALQILFFAFFVIVATTFHMRINKAPTEKSTLISTPWTRYLWILYLASALIVVRCLFRIAEYAGGQDGVLLSTETYLYIFDALLMFAVAIIFNLQHPSLVVNKQAAADYRMEQLYK